MRKFTRIVFVSLFCSLLVSVFQIEAEAAPQKKKRVIVGQTYPQNSGAGVAPGVNRQGSPSKPVTVPAVLSGKSADPWAIQRWQYQEVQKLMRF